LAMSMPTKARVDVIGSSLSTIRLGPALRMRGRAPTQLFGLTTRRRRRPRYRAV
jgi:hypothetical protein